MMLFSGCSFTYGDELENWEKERFSSYFDSHNIAQCGLCNDAIVRKTITEIESNPNKYDTVVVQFTLHTRTEVPLRDKYLPITPQNLGFEARIGNGTLRIRRWQFAKAIYTNDLWNMHIGKENMHKNMFFMQSYLRMKGLKYVFLSIDGHNPKHNDYTNSCWYEMLDCHITNVHDVIGFKRDHPEYFSNSNEKGGHPNALGHEAIAKTVKRLLSENTSSVQQPVHHT